MVAPSKSGKVSSRRKSQAITPQTVPESMTVPPVAPTVPDEMRDELTSLMQELLMKCHELSFEYSTLDCEQIQECPLAQKSKELFRTVKKLNELVKKFAQPPQTKSTYVS